MMRVFIFFISIAVNIGVLTTLAHSNDGSQAVPSTEIARDFEDIFFHEHRPSETVKVRKITRPILYSFNLDTKIFRTFVSATMQSISEVTGIQFEHAADGAKADFLIAFNRDDRSFEITKKRLGKFRSKGVVSGGPKCIWATQLDARPNRNPAMILIYRTEEKYVSESFGCVANAMWRYTGPLDKNLSSAGRVFKTGSLSGQPTQHEKLLLKTLYDDRIMNGASKKQTMPIVQELLKTLP